MESTCKYLVDKGIFNAIVGLLEYPEENIKHYDS